MPATLPSIIKLPDIAGPVASLTEGEPGTGKSVLKVALLQHDPKRLITPVVNRTLHTYHNTLRILCEAFQIKFRGRDHHCERLLVQQAFSVRRAGKMLVPIIDDAHLMPADCLRKLRLLCEDFPRSHNLVLIGQPPLPPLLQKRALQLVEREAGNFILPAFPGLIVKESYWRWPERDRAGNAIDFFVQVLGLSFHDAMRQITGT